jgi:hypothetical protein
VSDLAYSINRDSEQFPCLGHRSFTFRQLDGSCARSIPSRLQSTLQDSRKYSSAFVSCWCFPFRLAVVPLSIQD